MSYKRKGHITTFKEWCKHLSKDWKRIYWKSERNAGKRLIIKELNDKVKI